MRQFRFIILGLVFTPLALAATGADTNLRSEINDLKKQNKIK